jgi:hypothetical protein
LRLVSALTARGIGSRSEIAYSSGKFGEGTYRQAAFPLLTLAWGLLLTAQATRTMMRREREDAIEEYFQSVGRGGLDGICRSAGPRRDTG